MGNTHFRKVDSLYYRSNELKDRMKTTLIFEAVESNNMELVKYLVEEVKVKVNQTNENNNTPLIEAIRLGQSQVAMYLMDLEDVDLNVQNKDFNTALMEAIGFGHTNLAILLLQKDSIQINLSNREGNTALHFAIAKNDVQVFDLLIARQADQTKLNNELISPQVLAMDANVKPYFKLKLNLPPTTNVPTTTTTTTPTTTTTTTTAPTTTTTTPTTTTTTAPTTTTITNVPTTTTTNVPTTTSTTAPTTTTTTVPTEDLRHWLRQGSYLSSKLPVIPNEQTLKKMMKHLKTKKFRLDKNIDYSGNSQFTAFAAQITEDNLDILFPSGSKTKYPNLFREHCAAWINKHGDDTLLDSKTFKQFVNNDQWKDYFDSIKNDKVFGSPLTLVALVNYAHVEARIITLDREYIICPLDETQKVRQRVNLCLLNKWHYGSLLLKE